MIERGLPSFVQPHRLCLGRLGLDLPPKERGTYTDGAHVDIPKLRQGRVGMQVRSGGGVANPNPNPQETLTRVHPYRYGRRGCHRRPPS